MYWVLWGSCLGDRIRLTGIGGVMQARFSLCAIMARITESIERWTI
ncbi:MAG TPA: hypothetical protein VMW89_00295 [Desulfatiglandales bacterium]|nr:hypothetical protein [Desulfatiglandales bacterium]